MNSHLFYQAIAGHAIPLTLFTAEEYTQSAVFSDSERRTLTVMQFGAKSGEVALIWDEKGHLTKVYVGADQTTDAIALAQAVLKIPPGIYQVTNAISEYAVLLWSLAQYRFDYYQNVQTMPRVLAVNAKYLPTVTTKADAVFMVRDLINSPANIMNPEGLANAASELAKTYHAQCEVLCGDELLAHNYPAVHAVGRAAQSEPRFIHLTWGNAAHPHVTLVGKGVCFDSGGLDLKNAANMRLMKKDMGGAAHVLGLAKWLMSESVPIYLQVLIPAVENAVSAQAYRPGDILLMRNGLSVEIENTDAEGRLVLADALTKACEHNPEILIDFATLTGAARVAVGTDIAAMFSNNSKLAQEIQDYGVACSDPIWQLPLFAGYLPLFQSKIADLINSSPSPYAGAIIAALFLQFFVNPEVDWLHFDMMAWNICPQPGKPEGGEAMGLLAVGQYLLDKYKVK